MNVTDHSEPTDPPGAPGQAAPQTSEGILAEQNRTLQELDEAKRALEGRTQELAQTVSLLNATLDSMIDAMFAVDFHGKVSVINRRAVEMLAIPPAMVARADGAEIAAHVAAQLRDPAAELRRVGKLPAQPDQESAELLEFRDGRFIERTVRQQWQGGVLVGRVITCHDVTARQLATNVARLSSGELKKLLAEAEQSRRVLLSVLEDQKRSEEALRESEAKFRQIAENIHEVFWVYDIAKSAVLYVSPAYTAIWGRPSEGFLANPLDWIEGVHPDDRVRVVRATRTPVGAGEFGESFRIVRPDGGVRWIRSQSFSVRDTGGTVVRLVGTAEDITERRDLEQRLRHSQKLEAIGTLAGGIAHDFNNILAGINGFASLARQAGGGHAELNEHLDEIGHAGKRAADLVQQILAFSRAGDQAMVPVQLRQIVAEAAKLLRATIPSTIEFEVNLAAELPAVQGNATQLHQVVMNLVTNAWQAMRDKPGCLRIRLETCTVDEGVAQVLTGITAGNFVRLGVSDTGSGMDAATQERAFEPFFTTKAPGAGTGLGLSVVHGIVRSHQGAIRMTSEVGHGTTFEIYLPAIAAVPVHAAEVTEEIPHGRGEKILFVDDEKFLVRLGERVLTRLGYTADCENEVVLALARVERDPQAYRLIVTDQTMPVMTGLEFATRVHALRTDLPILLVSGYSLALTPERIKAAGVGEVLSKPFTTATLAQGIRRHLPLHP